MTHPLGEGRRILGPFRGKPGCAHWGTWGPGRVPMDKDSRAFGRSYAQVVRLTWLPFQPFLTKHKSRLPTGAGELYSVPKNPGFWWNSLLLIRRYWNGFGKGI